MVLPRDSFQMQVQSNVVQSWQQLVKSMEESLDLLENGLDEASESQVQRGTLLPHSNLLG